MSAKYSEYGHRIPEQSDDETRCGGVQFCPKCRAIAGDPEDFDEDFQDIIENLREN